MKNRLSKFALSSLFKSKVRSAIACPEYRILITDEEPLNAGTPLALVRADDENETYRNSPTLSASE